MYFNSTDRCCVSLFAANVQVFLFASVRAFPSCPQRLGCHSDQNARWLIHNACCFKPLRKPRSANSYFYQKATFSLVLIVSWRWVLVSLCHLCIKFWGLSVCMYFSKTFSFCFICRGWVCAVFPLQSWGCLLSVTWRWPFYVSHLLALLADDRTDDA